MSWSNAAEETDVWGFFSSNQCLKASPTFKAVFSFPSPSYKTKQKAQPEFNAILPRSFGSEEEPPEPSAEDRSNLLPLSACAGNIFLRDSDQIIPQSAVVRLKCSIHRSEFVRGTAKT